MCGCIKRDYIKNGLVTFTHVSRSKPTTMSFFLRWKRLDTMLKTEDFFTIGKGSIPVSVYTKTIVENLGGGGMCGFVQRYYMENGLVTLAYVSGSNPTPLSLFLSPKNLDTKVGNEEIFTTGQGLIHMGIYPEAIGAP